MTIDRKAAREGGGDDLYACAARWFGRYGPPGGHGWRVLAAKLRVVFEPEKGGRAEKRVMVELKAPDRSNLRDQTERHRLIAETLLARWYLSTWRIAPSWRFWQALTRLDTPPLSNRRHPDLPIAPFTLALRRKGPRNKRPSSGASSSSGRWAGPRING